MRYDARVLVEKKLDELGLLRGKSERPMTLAVCSRSGDIIEPLGAAPVVRRLFKTSQTSL